MKPKSGNPDNPGLLEYLEDIIGSDKYIEEIEQLTNSFEDQNMIKMEKSDKFYHLSEDMKK